MKQLLFIFILCSSIHSWSIEVIFEVSSETNGKPLYGVAVTSLGNTSYRGFTNEKGEIGFNLNPEDNYSFKFYQFPYKEFVYVLPSDFLKGAGENLVIKIVLEDQIDELKSVVIVADKKPDTMYGNPRMHVADYELSDSLIYILTYKQRSGKEPVLKVMNTDWRERYSMHIPFKSEHIEKDYLGRIYLLGEDAVYWLNTVDSIPIFYKVSKNIYYGQIRPIIGMVDSSLVYSNYIYEIPSVDYLDYSQRDSLNELVRHVEDSFRMKELLGEYKFMTNRAKLDFMRMEQKTGIPKEILAGISGYVYSDLMLYKPVFAPLKIWHDTLLVFDHYQDKLFLHADSSTVDSLNIHYHHRPRASGWQKHILQDEVTGKVYLYYIIKQMQYIAEFDPRTGEVGPRRMVSFKYVDTIKIRDGMVYYIYRPFESYQTKFIYRERIEDLR